MIKTIDCNSIFQRLKREFTRAEVGVYCKKDWIMEKVRCINEQGDEVIKGKIILKLL